MKNDKFNALFSENKIYLYVISIAVIAIARYDLRLGGVSFLILLYLVYFNFKSNKKNKENLREYIENLSQNVDTATKRTIINVPFPVVIIDNNGLINWYNSPFFNMFQGEYLLDKKVKEVIKEVDVQIVLEEGAKTYSNIGINHSYYDIYCDKVQLAPDNDSECIIMVYLVEKTDYVILKESYLNSRAVVAVIEIDNYDEMQKEIPDEQKPEINAEIDKRINAWAGLHQASIQKYSNGHYLLHFTQKQLAQIQEKRFDILDAIREINVVGKFQITLSIGVGINGRGTAELQSFAKAALDLALGRGGDQAVIKDEGKLSYFGGKTKAVEKRTRVKARVISHALKQLITESSQVLIMGHEIPDLDCMGAALGIYRACKQAGKESKIVLNKRNASIMNLMNTIEEESEYNKVFISSTEALTVVNKQTLLIVVDTHRPSFTESKLLTERVEKVVIIDHHRRSPETIEKAVITYIEPYASSTSELVTELLQYMFEKVRMNQIEAEALLAGIFIDTKNFAFQTGVRTFEAASFLRRMGADTTMTRQLFQDDLEHFIARSEVIKTAEIFKNNIAISHIAKNAKNVSLIAAQAADELLNIRGIDASFVMSRYGDDIYISGRSLGGINVQVILEKLGGGGHLTVAGAQLQNQSIEDAMVKLKNVIDEYLKEEE